MAQDEEMGRAKGWRELSQSRVAVWSAVGIIFAVNIYIIAFSLLAHEMPQAQVFGTTINLIVPIAIDLFLGINLLRGKRWARTWMLIRLVLGLLIWGIIALIQQDFGGLVMQAGVCGALLLLLTGTSTRIRVVGGVAFFLAFFAGGLVWATFAIEPTEPTNYTVYHHKIIGCSFDCPVEWYEATEKEKQEIIGQDPEVETLIEQGAITFIAFSDPSDSGALALMIFDFEKLGEPVPTLDDFYDAMFGGLTIEMKDFHLISSEKIKIGRMGEGGKEEAQEVTFSGEMDADSGKGNMIVTQHLSRMYVVYFLCDETAYETLRPAYDTFKKTFTF